jgi:hypothetical protein
MSAKDPLSDLIGILLPSESNLNLTSPDSVTSVSNSSSPDVK